MGALKNYISMRQEIYKNDLQVVTYNNKYYKE